MLKRGSCWPFLSPHPPLFAPALFSLVSSCTVKDLYQQCLAKNDKIAGQVSTLSHSLTVFCMSVAKKTT